MSDTPTLHQELIRDRMMVEQLIAGLRESLSVALELLGETERKLKHTQQRYYALLDERRRHRTAA